MIQKSLDSIAQSDIQWLVDNAESERRTIEFKRETPGNSDKEKLEYRKDVTSFANSSGGDLIFGIDAPNGIATDIVGIENSKLESEILRLSSMLRSNIEPLLPDVEFQSIPVSQSTSVIVARIHRSWRAPHLIRDNDKFRVYGRNSTGKFPYGEVEIRAAYDSSNTATERIKQWRHDRLDRIYSGETPVFLSQGSLLVIHAIPLESITNQPRIPATDLDSYFKETPPPSFNGWNTRYNLDGLVHYSASGNDFRDPVQFCNGYSLLFRTGHIEGVMARATWENDAGEQILHGTHIEDVAIRFTNDCIAVAKKMNSSMPLYICISILNAKGSYMHQQFRSTGDGHPLDRDPLLLPEIQFENYSDNAAKLLRPAFDTLWNAFGFIASPKYDKDGNRK